MVQSNNLKIQVCNILPEIKPPFKIRDFFNWKIRIFAKFGEKMIGGEIYKRRLKCA